MYDSIHPANRGVLVMPDLAPNNWRIDVSDLNESRLFHDDTFVSGYTADVGGGVPWLGVGIKVIFRRAEARLVEVRAATCGLPWSQGPTMKAMTNSEGAIPLYLVDQRDIQASAKAVDAERESIEARDAR